MTKFKHKLFLSLVPQIDSIKAKHLGRKFRKMTDDNVTATLVCLVYGGSSSNTFTIDIDKNKLVKLSTMVWK